MVMAFCGPNQWPPNDSINPNASPPNSAPGTLPKPPITHTTKALPSNRPETLVVTGNATANSTPQAPAMPAPMPKVIA